MVFLSACARAAAVQLFVPVGPRDAADSAFDVPTAVVDLGFRGEHRLRKTDEFSSVFAFRRAIRGKHFEARYRPNSTASARIGVVVSKKYVRSAVNRNLVKRIVRESFRLMRVKLPHCDIVVRVSTRLERLDRRALRGEIDEIFVRLNQ